MAQGIPGADGSLMLSGEPGTDFKEVGTQFITVFKRKEPETTTPQVAPQVSLTGLESKILGEISKNRKISRNEIAEHLGISPDTIKEYIEKLKKRGVLKRKGKQTSGGHWEVLE